MAKTLASQWAAFRKENGIAESAPTPVDVVAEATASMDAGMAFLASIVDGDDIHLTLTRVGGAKGSLRTKYAVDIEPPDEGPASNAEDLTDLLYMPADLGKTLDITIHV
ncbi:MAG: hypothetical protein DRI30_07365 [Chloroflexi bacterium]|nr:MAG: hypothetical protein DRI30_07365 [Chloroflexota bacterium]